MKIEGKGGSVTPKCAAKKNSDSKIHRLLSVGAIGEIATGTSTRVAARVSAGAARAGGDGGADSSSCCWNGSKLDSALTRM